MKISINTLEVKAEGTNGTSISLTNINFNTEASKTGVSTKVVDTESFSSEEKAIVAAFVNLINSK
jgi:trans-2-enoyl-CoA reductase